MVSIDNEAADQDERLRIYVLDNDNMHPPDGAAAKIRNEELLSVTAQDSREATACIVNCQVVPKLRRQLRDFAGIRRARGSNRDRGRGCIVQSYSSHYRIAGND